MLHTNGKTACLRQNQKKISITAACTTYLGNFDKLAAIVMLQVQVKPLALNLHLLAGKLSIACEEPETSSRKFIGVQKKIQQTNQKAVMVPGSEAHPPRKTCLQLTARRILALPVCYPGKYSTSTAPAVFPIIPATFSADRSRHVFPLVRSASSHEHCARTDRVLYQTRRQTIIRTDHIWTKGQRGIRVSPPPSVPTRYPPTPVKRNLPSQDGDGNVRNEGKTVSVFLTSLQLCLFLSWLKFLPFPPKLAKVLLLHPLYCAEERLW